MSLAIISAANQAAWAGKSLVDNTVTEGGDLIVLNAPTAVSVAGIEDAQLLGEIRRVINRGTADVTLAAQDAAAPAKDRFTVEAVLAAGKATMLFYNGSRWEPYLEA
jgi:hypothetical protein